MIYNLTLKKKINNIVYIYLFMSIIFYLLFIISPIVSLILNTPLYSFQKYFGLLGGIIILLDFVFNRKFLKNNYSYLLYIIIFISIISSIIYIEYGLKNNLFIICWSIIFTYLFYTYPVRVGNEVFVGNIRTLYNVILSIWLVACCISISAYLFNVGYFIKDNPYTLELTRQGFLENRLFGVFSSVNAASLISGILLIIGVYKYKITKYKYLLFSNFILFVYIILSGSRNVQISIFISVFVISFIYTWLYIKKGKLFVKIIKIMIFSILSVFLVYFSFSTTKMALSEIPKIDVFKNNNQIYTELVSSYPNTKVLPKVNFSNNENILNRKDVKSENISNNRLQIWKDYLSLYKDIGILGLSPSNYIDYIYFNYENLYIVDFVVSNDGGKNVDVYKTHNGYLLIYVTTGIMGISIFTIFIILTFKNCILYIIREGLKNSVLTLSLMIFIYLLTAIFFDRSYLFYNDILSCIFWLVAGYINFNIK